MLEERLKEVNERYTWLRAKLDMRYNLYWDEAKWTIEGCLECNAWHQKMKDYLDKRFWREFTRVIENAMDKATEVTV